MSSSITTVVPCAREMKTFLSRMTISRNTIIGLPILLVLLDFQLIVAESVFDNELTSFPCEQNNCSGRRGFVICVRPPLVDTDKDSYCMECWRKRQTCGTSEELPGCNRYCQEQVRLVEERKWESQGAILNQTFQEQLQVKELQRLTETEQLNQSVLGLKIGIVVLGVTVGGLVIALVVSCVCCRRRNSGSEYGSDSSLRDTENAPLTDMKSQDGSTHTQEREAQTEPQHDCYGDKKLHCTPAEDDGHKHVVVC